MRTLIINQAHLKNKALLTTTVVVDLWRNEHIASPRIQWLLERFQRVVQAEFSGDGLDAAEVADVIWLGAGDVNCDSCSRCNRLVTNCDQPDSLHGFLEAEFLGDELVCRWCQRNEALKK